MKKLTSPIPRFALTTVEAAASIGVGPDFFDTNIRPYLALVREGRKVLVPVTEIERWVEENASPPVSEQVATR